MIYFDARTYLYIIILLFIIMYVYSALFTLQQSRVFITS